MLDTRAQVEVAALLSNATRAGILVILRRVMKPQFLAVFGGIVAAGFIDIGYLFSVLT